MKKFGLVLGSGGARGFAHTGVLLGLREAGIKPDIIAGCSIGAVMGGAFLTGALDAVTDWAGTFKPLSALKSFSLKPGHGGVIDTSPVFRAFRQYDCPIESLSAGFAAIATDLETGEEVVITRGSLVDATRASSAVPVLFNAVRHEGRWLADGALANPLPVSAARKMGADVIVAVDINPPPGPAAGPGRSPVDTAYAAAEIFQMHLARLHMAACRPDIILKPDLRDTTLIAFDKAGELIERGRRALAPELSGIEKLLA